MSLGKRLRSRCHNRRSEARTPSQSTPITGEPASMAFHASAAITSQSSVGISLACIRCWFYTSSHPWKSLPGGTPRGVGVVVLSILVIPGECHPVINSAPLQVGAHRHIHLPLQTAYQYTTCRAGSVSWSLPLEGQIVPAAPRDQEHKLIHCEELDCEGQISCIAE